MQLINLSNNISIEYEGELYQKEGRAGYDIVHHEDVLLPPKQITQIKTNVRFPNGLSEYIALVTLRSSYQTSQLLMPAVGVIDSNYYDYIFITLYNLANYTIKINKGDRIAQLLFLKLPIWKRTI